MSKNLEKKASYEGKLYKINNGKDLIFIEEYVSYKEVYITFEGDVRRIKTNIHAINVNKSVKNIYKPSVCGVGIVGDMKVKNNGTHYKFYSVWASMLKRCYSSKVLAVRPNYKNVTVCEEWKTLSNFKKWFDKNYIEGYVLDKDLKVFNSSIYSPDTCAFIPNEVNVFLNSNKSVRGASKYCGIFFDKRDKKYYPRISCTIKEVPSKGFYVKEDAIEYYKRYKTLRLKTLLDTYKETLDNTVMENLKNCNITEEGIVF